MATIRETAELRLPSESARARWNGFVNEMIDEAEPGGRWTPYSWRRIERDSEHGIVQFERSGAGTTRMTVEIDEPGETADSPVVSAVRDSLHGDLERFCDGGMCELSKAA